MALGSDPVSLQNVFEVTNRFDPSTKQAVAEARPCLLSSENERREVRGFVAVLFVLPPQSNDACALALREATPGLRCSATPTCGSPSKYCHCDVIGKPLKALTSSDVVYSMVGNYWSRIVTERSIGSSGRSSREYIVSRGGCTAERKRVKQ